MKLFLDNTEKEEEVLFRLPPLIPEISYASAWEKYMHGHAPGEDPN